MIQYLRTERIIPPYQTKGYKLVELVRNLRSEDHEDVTTKARRHSEGTIGTTEHEGESSHALNADGFGVAEQSI